VRRLLPAAVAVIVLVAAAPAAATSPRHWSNGVSAARAYAKSRTGTVAFAVRTERGMKGALADHAFQSASVVKAMLLVAYLRQPAVRGRALTPTDRAMLTPMVRWSSNVDASRVRDAIGFGALDLLARRSGMTRFAEDPWWGRSLITARDQTRFFLAIDGLVPRRHRAYAMGLLERIVPRQRWGVARAAPRGWRLYFKGGWGSGRGLVDHQVALLVRGRERIGIAVFTHGNPDHAYATETLEGVFRRLLRPLR
jgi:hypothetical protein